MITFDVYESLGGDSMLRRRSFTTAHEAASTAKDLAKINRGTRYYADAPRDRLVWYRCDLTTGRLRHGTTPILSEG